jgi:hypothetical protein
MLTAWMVLACANALAADGWQTADSFNDEFSRWTSENYASDGTTDTYAWSHCSQVGWEGFIELTYDTAVYSDRLRIASDYDGYYVTAIDVDIQLDGQSSWIDVHEGAVTNCDFETFNFTAASVKKVRFRYYYARTGYSFWLYDLQLYATANPLADPTLSLQWETSVNTNSAVLHGMINNDGGAPCEVRFEYGETASYGTTTEWRSEYNTGQTCTLPISGLQPDTTYHWRTQIRNAPGGTVVSGADRSFTANTQLIGWVSPTSAGGTGWENSEMARDDNLASYARGYHASGASTWGNYIYLWVPSITCDGVALNAKFDGQYIDLVNIQVYKDGTWASIYTGAFGNDATQFFTFSSGTVTQARVRFHCTMSAWGGYWELNEFDFHIVNPLDDDILYTTNIDTRTSPAWVEGYIWRSEYSVNAARYQTNRWYLTPTLSATSTTTVTVTATDQNNIVKDTMTLDLDWSPTTISGQSSSENSITIRKNDRLLLTANGSGTVMTIDADGDSTADYTGEPGDKYAYQYTTAGTYIAEAKIDNVSVGTLTIHVVEVTASTPINCIKNALREKDLIVTPAAVKAEVFTCTVDYAKITMQPRTTTGTGIKTLFTPLTAGAAYFMVRLGGDTGPMIGIVGTNSAEFSFTGFTHQPIIKEYVDGDVLAGQVITVTPKLSGMNIPLNIIAGGGVFEDTGTSDIGIDSDEMNANGQKNYYIVTPPSGINCHFLGTVTDSE